MVRERPPESERENVTAIGKRIVDEIKRKGIMAGCAAALAEAEGLKPLPTEIYIRTMEMGIARLLARPEHADPRLKSSVHLRRIALLLKMVNLPEDENNAIVSAIRAFNPNFVYPYVAEKSADDKA